MKIIRLASITFFLLLIACSGEKKGKEKETVLGNDRDEHGCISSAGYTWSEVQQECIRLFENGTRMESADKKICFLVFSQDSLKVELFFPDNNQTEILDRRNISNGKYVWNMEDDDTKNVRNINGQWVIEQRGQEIYHEIINPNH